MVEKISSNGQFIALVDRAVRENLGDQYVSELSGVNTWLRDATKTVLKPNSTDADIFFDPEAGIVKEEVNQLAEAISQGIKAKRPRETLVAFPVGSNNFCSIEDYLHKLIKSIVAGDEQRRRANENNDPDIYKLNGTHGNTPENSVDKTDQTAKWIGAGALAAGAIAAWSQAPKLETPAQPGEPVKESNLKLAMLVRGVSLVAVAVGILAGVSAYRGGNFSQGWRETTGNVAEKGWAAIRTGLKLAESHMAR